MENDRSSVPAASAAIVDGLEAPFDYRVAMRAWHI